MDPVGSAFTAPFRGINFSFNMGLYTARTCKPVFFRKIIIYLFSVTSMKNAKKHGVDRSNTGRTTMWFEVIFIYLFLTAADKVIIMVYSSYFCSLIVRLFGFLIFFEHSVDRSVSSNLVKIFFLPKNRYYSYLHERMRSETGKSDQKCGPFRV